MNKEKNNNKSIYHENCMEKYNNYPKQILQDNFSAQRLNKLLAMCNKFENIINNNPKQILQDNFSAQQLNKILEICNK
jgi:hypothetical protein